MEIDGRTMLISEWSAVTGVAAAVIYRRLKRGASAKEAVMSDVFRTGPAGRPRLIGPLRKRSIRQG